MDEVFLTVDFDLDANCTISNYSICERWVHKDRQGSTVALTDSAGAQVAMFTYSPYGKSGLEGDTGFPFRYTVQKLDAETGLYYYKARYYDPQLGRFLQTDPIGYEDQLNVYAYVFNDPVNGIDPFGLETYGVSGRDDDSSVQNAFEARASVTGTDGTVSFGSGDEFVSEMGELENIEEANVFSHGWEAGLIGEDGTANAGFYISAPENASESAAYANDFANAVAIGNIDLAPNARITLFACKLENIAKALSTSLTNIGRGDVSVIGAEGNISPIIEDGREVGAINGQPGENFNTYQFGRIVDWTRELR